MCRRIDLYDPQSTTKFEDPQMGTYVALTHQVTPLIVLSQYIVIVLQSIHLYS
jgi:hypothetical protein